MSVESGLGTVAQACRAMTFNRSTFYRTSQERQESKELRGAIIDLSEEQPRYGYRRVTAVMRRKGQVVNPKRVQRVRRAEGLQVRKKTAENQTDRIRNGPAAASRTEERGLELGLCSRHDRTGQPFSCIDLDRRTYAAVSSDTSRLVAESWRCHCNVGRSHQHPRKAREHSLG